jgi:2-dehydropantoate 2-reductase
MTNSPARIYVLGIGNIGRFFAHALANSPEPPPISLLFHREGLLSDWDNAGRTISITTNSVTASQGVYSTEVIGDSKYDTAVIENLIVATKSIHTAAALSAIKHRLTSSSTALFTQNGMGTVKEVVTSIFPDINQRPAFLGSIITHALYNVSPFHSVYAGQGTVAIGPVSASPGNETLASQTESQTQYLLNAIVQAPLLSPIAYNAEALLLIQLEKLVMNAMVNPLTALFNCRNGELFTTPLIMQLMRLLLVETSQVLQSLPELGQEPETIERFSIARLESIVLDIGGKTAANTSSMLQDVRAGRQTEIAYINGYIAKRGKEVGISCVNTEKVVEMVKGGVSIRVEEIGKFFPGIGTT